MKLLRILISCAVWAYFKYLVHKEKKELDDKLETVKEDKRIKEAIQRGDAKEVARIIKFYREYDKKKE